MRQVHWTGDELFDRTQALPILVGTARLWVSLGYHGDDGQFHIDGVTGPDEYSAVVDDNTFTNLQAQRNLRYAAEAAERWPAEARQMDVTEDEIAHVARGGRVMAVPFDEARDVIQQDRGSTDHEVWDFDATAASDGYPLLLHSPYFDIYRKQVVKQADVVMAMHWCGDSFTPQAEGQGVRVLRGHHRARLVAVGVLAGGAGGRGRPPRPGPRLPDRGRADGPARPGPQHPRRRARRVAGRYVDRAGRRLRRAA